MSSGMLKTKSIIFDADGDRRSASIELQRSQR
jgi:hypothetical protein